MTCVRFRGVSAPRPGFVSGRFAHDAASLRDGGDTTIAVAPDTSRPLRLPCFDTPGTQLTFDVAPCRRPVQQVEEFQLVLRACLREQANHRQAVFGSGSGLPLRSLREIQHEVERICGGKPQPQRLSSHPVAVVKWVDGTLLDTGSGASSASTCSAVSAAGRFGAYRSCRRPCCLSSRSCKEIESHNTEILE